MELLKLSSQFTDFVKTHRPAHAHLIFDDIANHLSDIPELDGEAYRLARAFHLPPGKTDNEMLSSIPGDESKVRNLVSELYHLLTELINTTGVSQSTARAILDFKNVYNSTGFDIVRSGPPQPGEGESVVKSRTGTPVMKRRRAASLLVQAGILEIIPDFDERDVRLAERQYEWAKFVT